MLKLKILDNLKLMPTKYHSFLMEFNKSNFRAKPWQLQNFLNRQKNFEFFNHFAIQRCNMGQQNRKKKQAKKLRPKKFFIAKKEILETQLAVAL